MKHANKTTEKFLRLVAENPNLPIEAMVRAEQEANRQRHLYQDMTHIAQQLMRQLDELRADRAGGAA